MTDSNDYTKILLEESQKGKLKPVTRRQMDYILGGLTKEQKRKKDEWDEE